MAVDLKPGMVLKFSSGDARRDVRYIVNSVQHKTVTITRTVSGGRISSHCSVVIKDWFESGVLVIAEEESSYE
jgi:hypothetical protein